MIFKFAFRCAETKEFLGVHTLHGIPADRLDVAVARLWDDIDELTDPYGCEYVRLPNRGYGERGVVWLALEAKWQTFDLEVMDYYAGLNP